MKLTIIGCHGAYPVMNGATSGYLVEEGETKVLLDCGSGVLSRLQNYIELKYLDGVVISHYHPDHYADLGCLQYAVMLDSLLNKRDKPFTAWGPGKEICLTYKEFCKGISYLNYNCFQIGDLKFAVSKNEHEIASYAIKVTGKSGEILVYSGDTNYSKELINFAGGADWFLCESSVYANQRGIVWGHLSSTEAGEIARLAEVYNLCLTHFPHYGDIDSLKQEAGTAYQGNIILAKPGMCIDINHHKEEKNDNYAQAKRSNYEKF